jgi:hypothetical protein
MSTTEVYFLAEVPVLFAEYNILHVFLNSLLVIVMKRTSETQFYPFFVILRSGVFGDMTQ